MVTALEKLEKTHTSMFRKPQTAINKHTSSKDQSNKTADYVRYHVDDFCDH